MPKIHRYLPRDLLGVLNKQQNNVQNPKKLTKTLEKEKEKYPLVFEGFQKFLP
jgi:hypothetical protein